MSDCIPMSPGRMRPGSPNQNQPKLIRVKSSRIIGASLICHFLSSSLNTFGSHTSKAFAPESMCQPKWPFAAPSAKSGSGTSFP